MVGDGQGVRRVERSAAATRLAYDRLAPWYDSITVLGERRLLDEAIVRLGVRSGERLLEIGCGTGRGLVQLSRAAGVTGKVLGLDLSARMLGIARRRVERASLGGRVMLRQADAKEIPCAGQSFDAVLMSFTLELFDTPDIPRVLAGCGRVLRGQGRLGVVALSRRGEPGIAVRLYEWVHDKMPSVADCRPILVEDSIREAGFTIAGLVPRSLSGLPVEIVLASKPPATGA
jgi:ubiquinone/menaquinone biosynthesis C-methylase UbiE